MGSALSACSDLSGGREWIIEVVVESAGLSKEVVSLIAWCKQGYMEQACILRLHNCKHRETGYVGQLRIEFRVDISQA